MRLGRGVALFASLLVGVALAGVQLLPSVELAGLSARMGGELSAAFARGELVGVADVVPGRRFWAQAAGTTGVVTVGALPFLGVWLGAGDHARRGVWIFALIAAALSVLLVSGGWLYELYHQTPFGRPFRRPIKFLQVYSFAQALLAGLALARLEEWRRTDLARRSLWRSPLWLAGLAATAALAAAAPGRGGAWIAGMGLALAGFGAARSSAARRAALAALALLQAANLFFGVHSPDRRPVAQPEVFDRHAALLEALRRRSDGARTYLSNRFLTLPDLAMNQGTLRELRAVVAYQPLALRRYGRLIGAAARDPHPRRIFVGDFALAPESRFDLMDLLGTRFYVVAKGEPLDAFLADAARAPQASGFRRVPGSELGLEGEPDVNVYERPGHFPRAFLVGGARSLPSDDAVLEALLAPGFDPRREVLLEGAPGEGLALDLPPARAQGSARIRTDEAERVVVEIETAHEAVLLLTDAWYPGWQAWLGDRPVPVLRADYLFRAVRVPPGAHEIRFEFRPASLRWGIALSLTGGLVWLALALLSRSGHGRRASVSA
jgi:hypothetical protein